MTLRKFRWYNSPNSKFPGRRRFFTADGGTEFQNGANYTVSMFDHDTGNMSDYGTSVLECSASKVVFVCDLVLRTLQFDLVDGAWAWKEHPRDAVMFQVEEKPLIELADPNHLEDIPMVDFCFEEGQGSISIFIDDGGRAQQVESEDDEDEDEDAPADWVDDAR